MNKHTPGPWSVHDEQIQCPQLNGYGNWIITSIERELTPEDRANLKLMAAAPELLVALKTLVAAIHEYKLLDVRKRFSLCTADAQAQTAIYKVEGDAVKEAVEAHDYEHADDLDEQSQAVNS